MDDAADRLEAIELWLAYLISNEPPEALRQMDENDLPAVQYAGPSSRAGVLRHWERILHMARGSQRRVGDT